MIAHLALTLAALDLLLVLGLVAFALTAPLLDEGGEDVSNEDGAINGRSGDDS